MNSWKLGEDTSEACINRVWKDARIWHVGVVGVDSSTRRIKRTPLQRDPAVALDQQGQFAASTVDTCSNAQKRHHRDIGNAVRC